MPRLSGISETSGGDWGFWGDIQNKDELPHDEMDIDGSDGNISNKKKKKDESPRSGRAMMAMQTADSQEVNERTAFIGKCMIDALICY